jgi:hypothetical protein
MSLRLSFLRTACLIGFLGAAYSSPLAADSQGVDFVKEEIGQSQTLNDILPFNNTWLLILDNGAILEARKPPYEWRTLWDWWKGEKHQQPDEKFFFDITTWSTPIAVQLYDYKYNADAASRIFGQEVGNLATHYPYLLSNHRTGEYLFCRILTLTGFVKIANDYAASQKEAGRKAGAVSGLAKGYQQGYNDGQVKGRADKKEAEKPTVIYVPYAVPTTNGTTTTNSNTRTPTPTQPPLQHNENNVTPHNENNVTPPVQPTRPVTRPTYSNENLNQSRNNENYTYPSPVSIPIPSAPVYTPPPSAPVYTPPTPAYTPPYYNANNYSDAID